MCQVKKSLENKKKKSIKNMKIFFYILLILGALQLVRPQPLKNPSSHKAELEQYFHVESNRIAGDACLKLKNISATILADNAFNSSTSLTPLMQAFKKNITHFQKIAPFYLRFGNSDTLLKSFSDMVSDFQQTAPSSNKDFLYIQQLLRSLGWNELRQQYVNDFRKILPELKRLKSNISDESLINWLNSLEEGADFERYLNGFQKYTFTAKDHFVYFLQKQLLDITIPFAVKATAFSQRLLKSQKLSQLSPSLRSSLQENIQEELQSLVESKNIYQLLWVPYSYSIIIPFYVDNDGISLNELLLLIEILNDLGYEELLSNYRANYDKFLKNKLLREYERVKATLSQEELVKEKDFWNTFEKLKEATTFEERVKIVNAANKLDFAKL